mmetsp:Transcript_5977/g.17672  ORF Transcript_5977/g.17672 Transcript_5977/m.17672 type:complete len:357 (+) Transcript_5977:265-1335(+)
MDKLKLASAGFEAVKGAYGLAKDAIAGGGEGDDEFDPDASPLDVFADTDKLVARQSVDHLEAFVEGIATIGGMAVGGVAGMVGASLLGGLGETGNKYNLMLNSGATLKVIEKSRRCSHEGCVPTGRAICRPNHELQLRVYRPHAKLWDQEIMLIDRPFKCAGFCCTCSDCCAQRADLYVAPAGDEKAEVDPSQLTAIVQQPICGGCFTPTLHVDAPDGSRLATVEGGCCCIGGNCCDAIFTVKGPDGEDYGKVVKEAPDDFEELVKQGLTDADIFTMSVPKDAPNELKAAMMTSLLLMDYMYFEDEGDCYCNPFICVCGYKCCTCSSCGCLFPCGIFCGDRNSNTCCGWWDWLPCC